MESKGLKYKIKTKYLRVVGTLFEDNTLLLAPSYLSDNLRGSINARNSPLQIELYQDENLLLRWGASLAPFPYVIEPTIPPGQVIKYSKTSIQSLLNRPANSYPSESRPASVRAKIPFPENTDRIIFYYDNIKLQELRRFKNQPKFEEEIEINLRKEERGEVFKITWKATHQDNTPVFYNVRFSPDGKKMWRRLASRLKEPLFSIPRNELAGFNNCIIEIVAFDGINTVSSQKAIDVPEPSLSVRILQPKLKNGKIIKPEIIKLTAFAKIPGIRFQEKDADFKWRINGKLILEKPRGYWMPEKPGDYDIQLIVQYMDMKASNKIRITILEEDEKTKKSA